MMANVSARSQESRVRRHNDFVYVVAAGTISGCCSCVIFQPLDLVKTRMQAPAPDRETIRFARTFTHVVKSEGVRALWKGLAPSLMRMVPGVSLYFLSLEWMQRRLVGDSRPSSRDNLLLGAFARVFAGVVLFPATVLKTRFESTVYKYPGVGTAFRDILKNDGWKRFYSGLIPTVLRDAPFSGIYLMFYRQQISILKLDALESRVGEACLRFACGISAGIGACVITHPFDMLKTRMQLFPDMHKTSLSAVKYIYQKFGLEGFLRGIVPRALRRTLMAALSWTVFEEMLLFAKFPVKSH